jgi:uncharacterized protein (DUF4415 family)
MNHNSDDMREDYSDVFARQVPVRGKYYEQAMRAKGFIKVDEDVLSAFPSSGELNAALRGLIDASKHVHLAKLA